MKVIETVGALRAAVAGHRQKGARVALVPTMGNLHAGHLKLVEAARRAADVAVVSIYVNPLQFGPKEDLAGYPRTPEEDRRALGELGADILFSPSDAEMYPRGLADMTRVEVPKLGKILCGVTRPEHFAGVTTVVNRLFNLVAPDVAVFGKKDYQQLLLIRLMVNDLGMPIEIVGVETIREPDGLAMSSRNSYLSAAERRAAPALYRTLVNGAEAIKREPGSHNEILRRIRNEIERAGFRADYVALRRQQDLGEPGAQDRDLVLLAAATIGHTRLIDNIEFRSGR
jgi:pantoate--beta-alanine ligase